VSILKIGLGVLLGSMVAIASLPAQERAISVVPSGEQRVALLIGNDNYQGIPLKNAVNDAKAMVFGLTLFQSVSPDFA